MPSSLMLLSEKLADLTLQAESACKAQSWEMLELLQEERALVLKQLKDCVNTLPVLDDREQQRFTQILMQIRDTDAVIVSVVNKQKLCLFSEVSDLKRVSTMSKAYKDVKN